MRPTIVGIAGAHSGVGKTIVACEILRHFRGWGAIKYSRSSFFSSISDDREAILAEGKDTRRMADAGAARVLWVQSPPDQLSDILQLALGMLSGFSGIVVEGNSAVSAIEPDIVVFVSGDPDLSKESAGPLSEMADIILSTTECPHQLPDAARFRRDDTGGYLHRIKRIIEEKTINR
jgi:molybdopterin-guanine dinucleotide biosynthesis protein